MEQPREISENFQGRDKEDTEEGDIKSGDVEILIDFGREIVGFLEFELEAEPGVVLDFNCFEAIQARDIELPQTY